MPNTRIAVCPEDLQLFERDRRLGATSAWLPTFGVTEDGRLRTAEAVEARKSYLKDEHGLNLWSTYVEPDAEASQMILDYSDVPAPQLTPVAATNLVAPLKSVVMRPIKPAKTAASTRASAGPSAANLAADRAPQPAPTAIVQPMDFLPSTSAAAANPSVIAQTALATILQQQQQLMQLLGPLLGPAAPAPAPPKKSERKDPRKDQH